MSADNSTIPEDLLLSYFEGMLSADEAAQVAARLDGDPAAQALIADWAQQNAALTALFAPVAQEPIPAHISEIAKSAKRAWRWQPVQIAAMLAMLAVGLAGGWFSAQLSPGKSGPRTVAQAAISAHQTFVVEVAHPVEVGADQAEHLIRWVSKRLGHDLTPPDFATFNFRLMGGRVLPAETTAAAMFMYENDLGQRVSLYVVTPDSNTQTAFQFTEEGNVQSFFWVDGDLSYAVVGDIPRETLRAIALAAYDQLI